MRNIEIITASTDYGVAVDGAKYGPKEILNKLDLNDNVKGTCDVAPIKVEKSKEKEDRKKNLDIINEYNAELYNQAIKVMENDNTVFTLGGDHSMAIATALASSKCNGKIGIIWIDAHGDFNTFDTTITGNIHGLPLAAITGYEKESLGDFHDGERYKYENTVIVGGRDMDPLELENLKDAGVKVFSTEDIKKYGMEEVLTQAIDIASNGTNGIHISYDLDVIDPKIAMGVSVPAVNGINLDEAYKAVEVIIKNKEKIKSIDLVEYNPLRDEEGKTLNIAVKIANDLINNL